MTVRKGMNTIGVAVSLRTVQRKLANHKDMEYGKLKKRTQLTPAHVRQRFEWAKKMSSTEPREWKLTIFSDEKGFCLDGPDGMALYSHDKSLLRDHLSKRQRGGRGIMIWTGISERGKTPLVIVDGNMNAESYAKMLSDVLEPFVEVFFPKRVTFQQDGAPAHTAKYTREYFSEAGITHMDCPSRSPDNNCIENLWATLAIAVYDNGRQFDTIDKLKEALFYECDELDTEKDIDPLIESMQKLVSKLYAERGCSTKY